MKLKAGLEIHQQLDSHKLFCKCESNLDNNREEKKFRRRLHVTKSEMGKIDTAAKTERIRNFEYETSEFDCLVEADEEPPKGPNENALKIALQVAKMLDSKPLEEIQFMRKIIVDGSNTTGFQRTALIAVGGRLKIDGEDIGIEQICLEEDSCRKGKKEDEYVTDRLGIPLVEITTSPELKSPKKVREAAKELGNILRACGVKRGIGTIRQDVNISIPEGERVELKGFQNLDMMIEVIENEVNRQKILSKISKANVGSVMDVGKIIKYKNEGAMACKISGWKGLLGNKESDNEHPRLGKELSEYAKKSGVKGIMHSDELPNYGIDENDVKTIMKELKCDDKDSFVLVLGKEKIARKSLEMVRNRAEQGGVPKEVRKVLENGKSTFLRPIPGAARMYPETDIPPVDLRGIEISKPSTLKERIEKIKLGKDISKQLVVKGLDKRYENLISKGVNEKIIARILLNEMPEMRKNGIPEPGDKEILKILKEIEAGNIAKEGIYENLVKLARKEEMSQDTISMEELEKYIIELLEEKKSFVKENGGRAMGPLMGIVMEKYRGKIDGMIISQKLKEGIERIK
ncbi:MAG: glutamyl-tRNA(Gln) amidotransferase subunit E [Marine Group III euryarchaeote CG-Bathy1]|uniref:Glutamyl-tRNA(Gln) amidotransferase subunit E n=1 Tax=Marine Group III euryarchaeote CG-Bathy1 TaxID=1889001 RepID=A0A1J5T6T9_9ARCH|nr:MAG: glutamyl-tRNA(Gln) amidotransferase subunit E [Marine Group III euryarchaeote CG-Bathy1]